MGQMSWKDYEEGLCRSGLQHSLSARTTARHPNNWPNLCSFLAMSGASRPFIDPAALSPADWENIFQQTLSFADYQVNRLRWRYHFGGVLPGGFDANSIAAQAILKFLQPPSESITPSRRFPTGSASPIELILWEVKRLVLRHVSRLHHLKENWVVSNETDLARVEDFDGELVSPVELIPASDVWPDQALINKESLLEFHELKARFAHFLGKERRLQRLLDLQCDGISKPQALAAQLKLGVRTIDNLQKRLRRKWLAFSGLNSPLHRPMERNQLPPARLRHGPAGLGTG